MTETAICPVVEELEAEDGNGIPWLYIYIGFLFVKNLVYEIGLIGQYKLICNKEKCREIHDK